MLQAGEPDCAKGGKTCTSEDVSDLAKFLAVEAANRTVALQVKHSGMFCSDGDVFGCTASEVGKAEQFTVKCLSGCPPATASAPAPP